MFGKKKCRGCGSKIEKDFDFCPYCGFNLKKKEKDGLLDEIGEKDMFSGMGMAKIPFNKIISQAMKELPSIMKSMEDQMNNQRKKQVKPNQNMNFRLVVNGKEVNPFNNLGIPIKQQGKPVQKKTNVRKSIKQIRLTKDQAEKMENFPKIEPETMVRRLSNKIIYEINIPGAKKEDIIINKFKESIEIKAFTKDKVFIKIIPVGLAILKHSLSKGKLNLELKPDM